MKNFVRKLDGNLNLRLRSNDGDYYAPKLASSEIIIFCQHMICDGMSLAFLMRDILLHLSDPSRKPDVPVDLRSRLKMPVGESFGLYASGVKFKFRYDPKRNYWDNTGELSKQLGKEVNSDKVFQYIVDRNLMDPTLWDAQSFSFLGKMVPTDSDRYQKLSAFSNDTKNPAIKLNKRIREKTPELSVTNLGQLDLPLEYGPFELDKFYFVPSAGPFLEIVLGVVTVGEKLTITINYVEEKISKATVGAIKEQAMKCLDSIN